VSGLVCLNPDFSASPDKRFKSFLPEVNKILGQTKISRHVEQGRTQPNSDLGLHRFFNINNLQNTQKKFFLNIKQRESKVLQYL
jgi:hypothetical protein